MSPAASLQRSEVDGLEDVAVEAARLVALEWEAEHGKHVGEALHAEPHRPVAHVRGAGLRQRVCVGGDDAVERAHDETSDAAQRVEVEPLAAGGDVDEARQRQRGEVAHRDLVGGSVLHNLGAQVRAADRAEVLLV